MSLYIKSSTESSIISDTFSPHRLQTKHLYYIPLHFTVLILLNIENVYGFFLYSFIVKLILFSFWFHVVHECLCFVFFVCVYIIYTTSYLFLCISVFKSQYLLFVSVNVWRFRFLFVFGYKSINSYRYIYSLQ